MSEEKEQCPECGSTDYFIEDRPKDYEVYSCCKTCGYEYYDCYSDLYGVMSVPWGFLL